MHPSLQEIKKQIQLNPTNKDISGQLAEVEALQKSLDSGEAKKVVPSIAFVLMLSRFDAAKNEALSGKEPNMPLIMTGTNYHAFSNVMNSVLELYGDCLMEVMEAQNAPTH